MITDPAIRIGPASQSDAKKIVSILAANREDRGLFQTQEPTVRSQIGDYIVARDEQGNVVGCAAFHLYSPILAEICAVAVLPSFQGRGIGLRLVREAERAAIGKGVERLWLATIKPGYFSPFGYQSISRWELPRRVLLQKLRQVFRQPARRWLPALLGRHCFMERIVAGNLADTRHEPK